MKHGQEGLLSVLFESAAANRSFIQIIVSAIAADCA